MNLAATRRAMIGLAAAFALTGPAWAQAPATQTHDGAWSGSIKPPGQELHVVLHITTTAGETSAVLDSVDQGVTLPSAAYKVDGAKVSILFLSVGGELEGEFAADGRTFNGTWKQGINLPLTLTKQPAAVK